MYNLCGRSSSVEHQLPKLDRWVQFPSPAFPLPMSEKITFYRLIVISCMLLFLTGCATAPSSVGVPPAAGPKMPGVYHRVEKGQTLWRIARTYKVDLDEIARLNHISDVSSIETGRLIFIPGRTAQQPLPAVYACDDFIWPLNGRVINYFGQVYTNIINKGINIRPSGDSRVIAARNGRVVFYSDNFASYGKTVIIGHGDGIFTVYARNSEVFIKPGDKVLKGAVIASVGSAGRDKDNYLHFEVRKGHLPKNPLFYLPG